MGFQCSVVFRGWKSPMPCLFVIFSPLFFFTYLVFSMLAVLNIVTGVFVDKAVNMAKSQRDYIVEQDRALKEKYALELRKVFHGLDSNGDHLLSLSEVNQVFANVSTAKYFEALGFRPD